jgi:hypothetical protein
MSNPPTGNKIMTDNGKSLMKPVVAAVFAAAVTFAVGTSSASAAVPMTIDEYGNVMINGSMIDKLLPTDPTTIDIAAEEVKNGVCGNNC